MATEDAAPRGAHERTRKSSRRRAGDDGKTVSIIGAGRLGTALALALSSRGYSIEALVSRRLAHARRAARMAKLTRARLLTNGKLDQLPASDIIFITTPDDQLAETARRLAVSLRLDQRRKSERSRPSPVILHASGALSSGILAPLREAGLFTGSMHPLVSISEPVSGALKLGQAFYCVEGERGAVAAARSIVRDLGGRSFSLDSRDKALYHAAAVMASGHTVALFDLSARMLARCGLSAKKAREVLLPLLRSTLENLTESEPARALTGTFARGDSATVSNHLAALDEPELSEALAAYVLLGQHSLQLAKENGADPAAFREIARALAKAEKD